MPDSTVLRLDDYRERREQRVKLAASLNRADPGRAELLEHLARLAQLVGADRVATVWVDEYGPGLVHPHVVIDLLNDRPRRSFSAEPLRRAWENGVPGVLETAGWARADGAPWTLAVALGSDGTRSWFLAADAVSAKPPLTPDLRDHVMFIAGECSAIVLHRDLDAMAATAGEGGKRSRPRFAGWPILQDIEGREDDEVESRRIALRFIVARLPRLLVDDDLTIPPDRLRQQAERAREEIVAKAEGEEPDPEARYWEPVLKAFEEGDLEGLGAALLELGTMVETATHLHGATELYSLAYEIFAATAQIHAAVEAARFAGRAQRRLARWDEAHRWYGIARAVAETACLEDKVAVVLDGVANIHRDRGNLPAARATLSEALAFAERAGVSGILARVHHGFSALEHVAGNLGVAASYGWKAVRAYDSHQDRIRALASLAGVLIDGGALDAAEDAWTLVSHLSQDGFYRLYAIDALGHIAALRGDRAKFAARAEEVDRMGWESGPHAAKAEILLYRGLSYRNLDMLDQAEQWLRRAAEFSEENRFSQILFRAEAALEALNNAAEAVQSPAPPQPPVEVSAGLRKMRRELVGVGA